MSSSLNEFKPSLRTRGYSLASRISDLENGGFRNAASRKQGPYNSGSPEKYLMKQLRRNTVSIHDAASDGLLETIRNRVIECPSDIQMKDEVGLFPLHHAARNNRLETVNLLLELGAEINSKGNHGATPLHVAIRFNSTIIALELLKQGADPASVTNNGSTPLHFAAWFGNQTIAVLLAAHAKTKIDATDQRGFTALHIACMKSRVGICESLLTNGARVDICSLDKITPLHLATLSKTTEITELIVAAEENVTFDIFLLKAVNQGIDVKKYVESEDIEGDRPLQWAIYVDNKEVIELLFHHGTSSNTRKRNLQTPLHLAAMLGNSDLVELLIEKEALLNCKDDEKRTPLHCAASAGHSKVIELLLENSAKLESRDAKGMTPFLCAVNSGRLDSTSVLMNCLCNVEAQEKHTKTCLHLAVEKNNLEMLTFLLENACTDNDLVNKVDNFGKSPLHYAAAKDDSKMVELLLAYKADAYQTDNEYCIPLHVAAGCGNTRSVELLIGAAPSSILARELSGRVALHLAALYGETNTCALLLNKNANLNSFDDSNWTPLMCSIKSGSFPTAELLIKTDTNAANLSRDKEGNTTLHIAARHNEAKVVKILLDRQCDIGFNNDGQTFFGVAMQHGYGETVMAAVKHNRWREIINTQGLSKIYPLEELIRDFPDATKVVLDRCVQYSNHRPTEEEYSITYDFRMLDPGPNSPPTSNGERFFGLNTMIEHNQEALINHSLSRKLFDVKWSGFGRPIYFLNLFIYILFLTLLTTFLLSQRQGIKLPGIGDDFNIFLINNVFTKLLADIILIFATLMVLKEIFQLVTQRRRYFKDLTNILDWGVYFTSFLFLLPYAYSIEHFQQNERVSWQIGTVSVMLGYFNLVVFSRVLPFIGLYASMFLEVIKTFINVMGLLVMFVLGYSLVFFILFKEQDAFKSYGLSIVKTTVMMVGEFDYTNILVDAESKRNNNTGAPLVPFPEVSYVVFYLFLLMISVALMNLLVGLAVGDIEAIRKTAYMRMKAIQINFMCDVEIKYPRFITRRLYKPLVVYCPNKLVGRHRKSANPEFFEDTNLEDKSRERYFDDNQRYYELKKEVAGIKNEIKNVNSSLENFGNVLNEVAKKLEMNINRIPNDQEETLHK